jgi:3-oxoacyl-[acyl-carrier protein] reductase
MDLNLKGKRALVTGASTGLGAAASIALASEGVELYINSRSQEKLTSTAKSVEESTGVNPKVIVGDVSTKDGLDIIKESISEIDILVSNAGGPPPGQFTDVEDGKWDEAHNLVLRSAQQLTKMFINGMIERKWGRLIYITSFGVLQPINDLILSNTYRSAVTGMCKTISNNYAKFGITANCVCPGFTETDRLINIAKNRAKESGKTVEEIMSGFASMAPAGRVGDPNELAALITFLASDKAAYITGSSIAVDGGIVSSLI